MADGQPITRLYLSGETQQSEPLYVRLSFTDLRKSSAKTVKPIMSDKLFGGLADKKPLSTFDFDDIEQGAKVEREHTSDSGVAREIARDHLAEDKDYYRKLAKMESSHKSLTKLFVNA